MTQRHPLQLSLILALVVLGTTGCVDGEPTSPGVRERGVPRASSAPAQPHLIGPDAEFARIARAAPGFGGMFYDADGRLNVYLTPAARQSAQAKDNVLSTVGVSLRAQGRGVPAAGDVVVLEGTRDYQELASLHDRVLPLLGESGVVFTDIDETRNRISVGVLAGTSEAGIIDALQGLGVPSDAVSLEVTRAIVPHVGTLQDYQDPTGGGLQISFEDEQFVYICTLGFNVLRGETDRTQEYFFTNSHCTLHEAEVTGIGYWMPLSPGTGQPGTFVGVEVEDPPYFTSPCFTGWRCRWSDAALVRYAADIPAQVGAIYHTMFFGTGAAPGSIELDAGQRFHSIVAERPWSMVGETVDKVGRTSGWTRGRVTRNCVNLGRGGTPPTALLCQAFVNAHSFFGDSGSPVFQPIGSSANARLHGILWGGPAGEPFDFFIYSIMDALREDFDGPDCRWTGPDGTVRCPRDRAFVTH
jgi:hypothetical protein